MKCRNSTKTQKWARIPSGSSLHTLPVLLCKMASIFYLGNGAFFNLHSTRQLCNGSCVYLFWVQPQRPTLSPSGSQFQTSRMGTWPCSGQVFDPGVGVRVQGRNSQQQFRVPREGRIVMILADTPCGEGGKQQLFCFNKHVLSTSHVPGPGQACRYKNKCSQFCLQRV